MNLDTRCDLVGFALAIAVRSLQETEARHVDHADDIAGMLRVLEADYHPDETATFFWCTQGMGGDSCEMMPDRNSALSVKYWDRVGDAFNAMTAEVYFGEAQSAGSNIIDFLSHAKTRRKLALTG